MKKQKNSSIVRSKTRKEPSSKFTALRSEFYSAVAEILQNARWNSYRALNFTMVEAYWNIGRIIVEEEQQGKERAEYGRRLLIELSVRLTQEFGKGYNTSNLRYMRQFYLAYPIYHAVRDKSGTDQAVQLGASEPVESFSIRDALRPELRWTRYRLLLRAEKPETRT
ncbi:MAG: DUF1016 family protein [Desulfobacteraceae bacterium]|nr:MAG: DUF1016 family protein [Desulfobacteraceae bacterium]